MAMFVDASALIAIIAGEPDADALSDRLDADPVRFCSTVSAWEAVAGLVRSHGLAVESADHLVRLYLDTATVRFIPMGETEFEQAVQAYARFGKGRHPAGLNMGDCFAYACAKTQAARLLYKGNDFALTDLA